MVWSETISYSELFRESPIECSLISIGPVALAFGQLGNSYINGISPVLAIAFAIAMITFAVVATGHYAAAYRLRQLESSATR
ncbi:hypothetical protein [Halostagnicola sp. A-GB9-2]|uniref:hypothetical protein n=1 Tax=Halostagnicola sp. A-GB9-2 TaxID=3048066 RepID=UPI0024BF9E60|nr:hypothetical protein [Halostagnicola sp. A-GB9-2]MDJ1432048.1 hypothetical protein [Halostagnicola sp. A-GB9-2]